MNIVNLPTNYNYSGVWLKPAAGETDLPITTSLGHVIPYIDRAHIHVYVSADDFANSAELARPADYDFDASGTKVILKVAATGYPGQSFVVRRETPVTQLLEFHDGALLPAEKLELFRKIVLYRAQESQDQNVEFDVIVQESAASSSSALTQSQQAVTQVAAAVQAANSAQSISSSALSAANAAQTDSATALTAATTANSKADSALAAVSAVVVARPIADISAIPSSPSGGDVISVQDSTGIEGLGEVANLPSGFVGDPGLAVTLQYNQASSKWDYIRYQPNDPDSRYWVAVDGTTTQKGIVQLSTAANSTDQTKAATPSAVKIAKDAADAAQAAAVTANGIGTAAQNTANAALPKSGGTMTGPIVFSAGQQFPIDSVVDASTTQKGIVQLTADLTGSSQTLVPHQAAIAGLNTRVTSAESDVQAAQTAANAAGSTAATALSAANAADALASTAQATATDAQALANDALTQAAAAGTPAGTVIWVAMQTAPNGYLKANGAAVSRTTYADLFAAIGTTFGTGDGSTTFNLPDLRGEFIRGWDDGRGVDTGRTFGSFQADEFRSHTHIERWNINSSNQDQAGTGSGDNDNTTTGPTGAAGGDETRPRNIALLACIKT